MAYVIVWDRVGEIDRRGLDGPLTLGRSPDCGLTVRDISLSRKHCKIERSDDGAWHVVDLGSKNGTHVEGAGDSERIDRRALVDGQTVRIGRTRVTFHAGDIGAAAAPPPPRKARPVDPVDALAGTVVGFEYVDRDEPPANPSTDGTRGERATGTTAGPGTTAFAGPRPKPRPADPAAYQREQVYDMLSAIASSSWDSIYEQAKAPATLQAPAADAPVRRRKRRPASPVDFTLQVDLSPRGRTWRGLAAAVGRAWARVAVNGTSRLATGMARFFV